MIADLAARYVAWLNVVSASNGALITASVTVAVFFATRIFETIGGWRSRRAAKRRTVMGLYKEVTDNLAKLGGFPSDETKREAIKDRIRADPHFRPVFVVQESTKFYDLSALTLPDIHSRALLSLSGFYDRIGQEIAIVRTFEGLAFPTISDEGRAAMIDDLWEACKKAETEGKEALSQLERAYPRRWFRQFKPER